MLIKRYFIILYIYRIFFFLLLAKLGIGNTTSTFSASKKAPTVERKTSNTQLGAVDESDQIREEYEEKLTSIQQKFEEEQLSKLKLGNCFFFINAF